MSNQSSSVVARLTVDIWPTAARMLGVSRGVAYEMARTGQLPVIRCGRRLVVPLARLKAMLGESATPAAESGRGEAGDAT